MRPLQEFNKSGVESELSFQFSKQFSNLQINGSEQPVESIDNVGQKFFRLEDPFNDEGKYSFTGQVPLMVKDGKNGSISRVFNIKGAIELERGAITEGNETKHYPVIKFVTPITLTPILCSIS